MFCPGRAGSRSPWLEELPGYVEEVLALKGEYRVRTEVRLGIEADFVPGHEDELGGCLCCFRSSSCWARTGRETGWSTARLLARFERGQAEVDAIHAYAGAVIATAGCGLFDVLTHLDRRKFGHRPSAVRRAAAEVAGGSLAAPWSCLRADAQARGSRTLTRLLCTPPGVPSCFPPHMLTVGYRFPTAGATGRVGGRAIGKWHERARRTAVEAVAHPAKPGRRHRRSVRRRRAEAIGTIA